MSSVDKFRLPKSLKIRDTPYGRGLFTRTAIKRRQTVFDSKPYAIGIGGVSITDMTAVCHHCLSQDYDTPILCDKCKVAGYCSRDCLEAASPLHAMECTGLAELEKLRGDLFQARYTKTSRDTTRYWPPPSVLMIARAINRRILLGKKPGDDWISYLYHAETLHPMDAEAYPHLEKYIRLLVPKDISEEEIYKTYCTAYSNAFAALPPTGRISVDAIYYELSLLNHMCKPNCDKFKSKKITCMNVSTLEDIKAGSQLGISYVDSVYYLNVREIRRKELKEAFGFDCRCYVCTGEEQVGSKFWLLDQQKRSLIAPWSLKMAKKAMDDGWEVLTQARHVGLTPLKVIQLLEPALETQKLILDKRNVILLITITILISQYAQLGKIRKVTKHLLSMGMIGMNALVEYGTASDVIEIHKDVLSCYKQVGREGDFLAIWQKVLPELPSHF